VDGVTTLPLGTSDWARLVAKQPQIPVLNRYFEETPTNQVEGASLLARPALRQWKRIGTGPIQGIYSQPGSFSDALFAVSGGSLYRVNTDNSDALIGTGLLPGNPEGFVRMAATAAIGSTPEMLYIADGAALWLYLESSYAFGTLTLSGALTAGEGFRLGSSYYQWTGGSVDAGTPAGTLANPWLVKIEATSFDSFGNAWAAVNGLGNAGVQYSTALTANVDATARSYTTSTLNVQSINPDIAGNSVVTTETGANLAWGAGNLSGGGAASFTTVDVPDSLKAIAVAFIAGYIIVVVAPDPGFVGRFFWIEPGETYIRNLSFATAERLPDPLHSVRTVGDQIWLFGTNTTEVWYPTGDVVTPFIRTQGQLFDRGIVEGTDVQIRDVVYVTDREGNSYALAGGQGRLISDPSVAERNREALKIWGA
jgi:hypothetical protein